MRGEPGFSRPAAWMNLPSQLALVGHVSGGQATTFEADVGLSMQTQLSTTVWGELSAAPGEGGVRAWTLAFWWIMDSVASSYPLLDLFTEILIEDAIYCRRRTTIRSLGHLSDASDHGQTMRISDVQIAKLQQLLMQHFGLDYSTEEAQDAGRAILRFVGLKLYQQLERDRLQDGSTDHRRGE